MEWQETTATLQCPYCGETIEVTFEPDVAGELVQDCEVCCRPLTLRVAHDEHGNLEVDVERSQ